MDMELQRTRLGGFRPVYDALLRQEETLESIVPDAMPDIARIVEASGTVLLRQKETADGSVRVTGTARAAVLYLPEGGGAPCCLPLNIPFLCNGDNPAIHGVCRIQATARVISADAQMLNPRKVLVRVELAVGVTAYAEETTEICFKAECEENAALQTLLEDYKDFIATDLVEKIFNFSDVLRLPVSKPAMEQLLSARAELSCAEAKVIGKKLVAKGDAVLSVLYRCESGVASARFELPFSQIVEVQANGEDSDVWVDAVLTGMDCVIRSEGELEVSFEVLLQTVIYQEREVRLLADLYSTANPLETEREKACLSVLVDQGVRRQIARQLCESAIPAKQVIECRLTVGEVSQVPAGENNTMVTAKTYADILYLSENDVLCSVSYAIPANCELQLPEGCQCTCRCRPAGEASATPVADGLEVRFEAEFAYLIIRPQEVFCVSAVRPGQADEGAAERPSVIIRMVGEGERLWDVAKCCGSTVADIQAANAMGCDDAPCGSLLLIPKCR